jgi:deoxyribose-phosphate aldolase
MDLTSLNSTDSEKSLDTWMKLNFFNNFGFNNNLKPAAICVYPNFSSFISKELKKSGVKTAVVSTNFPTG